MPYNDPERWSGDMKHSTLETQTTAPSARAIADALRPLIPPGYGVVLFGSRVTGRARSRSDWDIGIVGESPVPGALLERIREALDALPTLATFEVVDLTSASAEFRHDALGHAVRLM